MTTPIKIPSTELVKIIDDFGGAFLTNIDPNISYDDFQEYVRKTIGIDNKYHRLNTIEFGVIVSSNLAKSASGWVNKNRIQNDIDLKTAFKFIDHAKNECLVFYVTTKWHYPFFIPWYTLLLIGKIVTDYNYPP